MSPQYPASPPSVNNRLTISINKHNLQSIPGPTVLLSVLLLACSSEKPVLKGDSIGSCSYTSPFSKLPECRDFYGAEVGEAEANCAHVDATFQEGVPCEVANQLGTCTFEEDGVQIQATVEGTDASNCGSNRFGCEVFANGYWEPSSTCSGTDEIEVLDDPFPQPVQECSDPLPGEPAGQSANGQVCTWDMVSGATEEGRHFSDYAQCAPVIRQRGYTAVPANPLADEPDPRMDDPEYVAEVDWVRGQVESGSCECCHSSVASEGAAVFNTDFEGNFANQFNDRGLAMAAGWIPTIGFGTYPPEQNNGFERSSPEDPYLSIIPTTDQARMMAFFEGELTHRGVVPDDFAGDTQGAGPLDEQLAYEPEQCSDAEGIGSDGTLRWLPGRARYIYVLAADATSPTVPPNLDLPDGTSWRVDLPADGSPVESETVVYGQVPAGMIQVFPASGPPEALVPGKEYYLYVSADVLYPISRCIFTAGEDAPRTGCNTGAAGGGLASLALAAAGLLRRRR